MCACVKIGHTVIAKFTSVTGSRTILGYGHGVTVYFWRSQIVTPVAATSMESMVITTPCELYMWRVPESTYLIYVDFIFTNIQ